MQCVSVNTHEIVMYAAAKWRMKMSILVQQIEMYDIYKKKSTFGNE